MYRFVHVNIFLYFLVTFSVNFEIINAVLVAVLKRGGSLSQCFFSLGPKGTLPCMFWCFPAPAHLISIDSWLAGFCWNGIIWLRNIKAGKYIKHVGQCALRTRVGNHFSRDKLESVCSCSFKALHLFTSNWNAEKKWCNLLPKLY